jgi:hypothetical protein
VDAAFSSVRERPVEDGPNWGLVISFALSVEIWMLVGIAVLELK